MISRRIVTSCFIASGWQQRRHFLLAMGNQDREKMPLNYDDIRFESLSKGRVDRAPRESPEDFEFTGKPDQVIPGAHPLPLSGNALERMGGFPLVSPFLPSPSRIHPYFLSPPTEWPHFESSVPIVYTYGTLKAPIVVPVHSTKENGAIIHTRALDPYVFGLYPTTARLAWNSNYWQIRTQNFKDYNERSEFEIFRHRKKPWANTGTGMGRVGDRRDHRFLHGGRFHLQANKPWNARLPVADPTFWHESCRMTLCLKMLQGKLMIVDQLTLPEPTTKAFLSLCERMQWDVKHDGGGVLFMDGGSRLTPSKEFDHNFFYGSFANGRIKVIRPTVRVGEPYDWNRYSSHPYFLGPQGQKNPVPRNRFNTFDALDHHLLVITEGAVAQLEAEMFGVKVDELPPHIRQQLPLRGALGSPLLGDFAAPLQTVEEEAAGRIEASEKQQYEGFYDNPYKPWADEHTAAYEVDQVNGRVRRHVPEPGVGTWQRLE